jgi:hypothetical protein
MASLRDSSNGAFENAPEEVVANIEVRPRGLKPASIGNALRGAEAPLFHGTAQFPFHVTAQFPMTQQFPITEKGDDLERKSCAEIRWAWLDIV